MTKKQKLPVVNPASRPEGRDPLEISENFRFVQKTNKFLTGRSIKGCEVKIGIIGGSGVYEIEGIEDLQEVRLKTPFGLPSDAIIVGKLADRHVAFLPRHARGHKFMPTEVNSQANIYSLKSLGVERIIAISACGSLKQDIKPRDFVLPGQLFDRTRLRNSTFFGSGIVGHIAFDEPYCTALRKLIYDTALELDIRTHFGGTYVCIEGPAFSTRAESEVNRKLGFSVVGMTALPEAKLAREAEMCYVTVALVTDYDVWKAGEEVSVAKVVENLSANVGNVKRLLKSVIPKIPLGKRVCPCSCALKNALFTQKDKMDKHTIKKLSILVDKHVKW